MMENRVLQLLDIETAKSETTKDKVLIVKRDGAKMIGWGVLLMVLIAGALVFNSAYKLNFVRREVHKAHVKADVFDASSQATVSRLYKELQSHLVSEIKERDDTVAEHEAAMDEVEETLDDNEDILQSLFNGLDASLQKALEPLPAAMNDMYTNDRANWDNEEMRKKKVKDLVTSVQQEMDQSLRSARDTMKESMAPLQAQVAEHLDNIVGSERARSNAASEHLGRINEDLAEGEMRVLAANSRLEEQIIKGTGTYSPQEAQSMLSNVFASLRNKISELTVQQDEIRAEKGNYGKKNFVRSPLVLKQLQTMYNSLRSGAMPVKTAASVLQMLVVSKQIPSPDPDMDVPEFIAMLIRLGGRSGTPVDCTAVPTCNFQTPCSSGSSCVALTDALSCPSGTNHCTKFASGEEQLMLGENKKQIDAYNKLLELEAQLANGGSASYILELVIAEVVAHKIPVTWLVRAPEVEKEAPMSEDVKQWLTQAWKAIGEKKLTQDKFYSEIMTKYNEGKLSYQSMSRLTRRLGQMRNYGSAAKAHAAGAKHTVPPKKFNNPRTKKDLKNQMAYQTHNKGKK